MAVGLIEARGRTLRLGPALALPAGHAEDAHRVGRAVGNKQVAPLGAVRMARGSVRPEATNSTLEARRDLRLGTGQAAERPH